jgi:hypothetical protein
MAKPPVPAPPAATKPAPSAARIEGPLVDPALLPPRVAALRDKILDACAKRDVEALKIPIQWAETPPIFLRGPGRPKSFAEIVDFLRARSFDRRGVEMVAILRAVFESPFARRIEGPFETYVWPAQALIWPRSFDSDALARLWALVRFADLGLADAKGRPLIHSAGVGKDGTWHWFTTEPAESAPSPAPVEKPTLRR